MYPVVRGNGGWGGEISDRSIKHVLLDFNCLGIKGTRDVTLVLPAVNNDYQTLEFTFRKQCSNCKNLD